MDAIDDVWSRIQAASGETFKTATGLEFTYRLHGQGLRVRRDGREINRTLTKQNFAAASARMPVRQPSALRDLQGPAYTWAILADPRIQDHA